ncbi:hypothetical protein BDW59DRAFT_166938 [Aspergillus cavernicola]|uniref:Uncharacterized protein n=1 Tax=Aspergillus cavernicola TaxID=176166 RepID=A0ABR4HIP5_9EURO
MEGIHARDAKTELVRETPKTAAEVVALSGRLLTVTLLPFADLDYINGVTSAYLQRFILYTEVSSAMHQEKPLQRIAYSWIRGKGLIAASDNPSSAHDATGASVAELQASYTQLATQNDSMPSSQRDLREWRTEAKRINEQLLAWARSIPDYWQSLKFINGQVIDPSIPTHRSVCEVCPSCQIATIWNLWRVQRLSRSPSDR